MPTVRPPHWSELPSSNCEGHACQKTGIDNLLRAGLGCPMWTRPLPQHRHLNQMLVAFRFLLAAETQFVARPQPVPMGRGGGERTVEVVLAGAERGDHGLPVHPPVGGTAWRTATADLIAGSWFAHVQHTAELLEVALEELGRSQFVVAAAAVRTALEMAARISHGSRELSVAANEAETDELVRWLAVGDGAPRNGGGPTARVRRLIEEVRRDDAWPDHFESLLDGLYGRLCDRAHPRPESWSIYARPWNLPVPAIATSPKDTAAARAADDVLTAAAVVTVGMRRCWTMLHEVVAELRASGPLGETPSYTLTGRKEVDVTQSYPYVNIEDTFVYGLGSQLRTGRSNIAAGPLMAPHVIVDYFGPGRMQEGAVRPHGEASDSAHQLIKARLLTIAELQRSTIKSLNVGRCASAAAIARFLLEHVSALGEALTETDPGLRVKALLKPSDDINAARLAELLEKNHLLDPPPWGDCQTSSDPVDLARKLFNGMVHGDLVARNVYWREYGDNDLHLVTIPSHPKYPMSEHRGTLGLDNPWVGAAVAVEIADWFVVTTCGGLLNGRW